MNNDIMEATNRIAFKTKHGKISIDATRIEDRYYFLVNSKDNAHISGIELDSPYLLLFLDKIIFEDDKIAILASGRENVKLESIYKVEDDTKEIMEYSEVRSQVAAVLKKLADNEA